MLWNAGGNIVYLGTQWLITVLVTVLGDLTDAGILSIAMSISATFQTISLFGMRSFQVSDREGKYSDSAYVGFRPVICGLSLLLCLIFSILNRYPAETTHAIAIFMIFRLSDSYSDVLHGIAQKHDRLDIAGKSFALKGIGLLVCFLAGYWFSKELNLGLGLMSAFACLVTLAYDLPAVKRLADFDLLAPFSQYKWLALETLPLCIYQFLYAALTTVPKWILERQCGTEILGGYSSIFAPAMLLQSAGGYLYVPFATKFSAFKESGDRRAATGLFGKISLAIVGMFALILPAAYFLGDSVLLLLFGEKITPYLHLLIPILFVQLAITYLAFLSMLMIVLRKIGWLMAGYGISVALLALTPLAIRYFDIDGVNYALLLSCGVGILIFLWQSLTAFSRFEPQAPAPTSEKTTPVADESKNEN